MTDQPRSELPSKPMNTTLSIADRERLLRLARAASLERSAPKISPIVPVERGGRLALSFAQQRLWFLEQLGELGSTYHIPMRLRLRGVLDRAALARALERIVARHESLRTVFVLVEGEPEQRILPVGESGFRLVEHDLRGDPHADAEVERLVAREADAPFDLERGPLVRTRLVRLADDDHLLLLTMHHVVSDAWSMGVFTRELVTLYTAFSQGEPDPLPALPVQYADYAAWQRHRVKGEVLDAQAAYWTQALAGAPELLELPTDHARPARQDHAGAMLPVELGRELTAGLKALSHRHGTTLYMTVVAGWAAVLARLSGQDDVVVGTPSVNRARPEVEELIGFFVNTLALRVDLSARPTVAELLAQVKTRSLEGQRNQDIPFEQVVERLRPARSLAYSPLFQVMFAWQETAGGALELPGLTVDPAAYAPHVSAKFDLLLSLGEADGQLMGKVEYATSLFEQATVERWVGYLRAVLEGMVADDALGVDRLPMLPEAERALVLREFNDTWREYPREACVHELFEAQAERTPSGVAVVFEGDRVTYAELNARANRLAHHLRALGVGPDARVGICVQRSVEMVVGLLGILKAGGAYVPLDASYPVDRLRNMLEDSAPAVLLTHPPQAATAAALSAGSAIPVLDLTADEAWAHRPATNPGREGLGPRNLAHVLFTSGSTGRPKGVMLEHGSLVNRLAWMQDRYGMTPDEALLQKTPFSFDVSFWEFFWPLMVGARLVMARPDGHRDPAYLVEVIRREGVTVAHFVPSMLPLFLEHPEAGRCTGLLRVPVSGEAVSAGLVRQFHQRLPGVGLFNQYGPTESGEVTEWACDPGAARVSIGRAIHNSAVYVLDRAGEPVPVGVAGELFIGGVAVARGYLGRPRLTAERFVPDPFGEPGARLYRTGDLCRWLADGTLEYLGRTDFQVKVRGFRVELGEIEAALRQAPGVTDCVVVAREDATGDRRLAAYIVGDAEAEALRDRLRRSLPEYMVPSAFVRLDAFPVTPNGKLDRKALPAPEYAAAEEGYVAPRTPTEEVLAGVWAEMLGRQRVGAEESFFDLGGHSLLATRVASRVRQVFGVEVPLRAVFERPVLRELAAEIDRLRGSGAADGADAIAPAAREGDLPVTFAQERLWFVDALDPGSPAYAIPFSYGITGPLDEDALRRALAELVRRHEPLRTTLPAVDGVPVQRIAPPPASFDLPVADLRHLPEDERRAEAERLAAEAAQHRFDLARGPLFRASLVRLADAEHRLLLNLHHAIGDGWSLGVLLEELSALYGAFSRREASPLPEPALQYADYAVWQREHLSGAALERQVEFWRRTLAGAPALLELPTDRPRPPVESHRGGVERLVVPSGVTADVHALARREGATLFMVLLSALDVVLGRLAGQEDVVVGTPIAGRTRAETDRMVGLFLNSLALRTDLSGDPTFRELLGRVRETTLSAYAHQELPFERVLEEVRPERSLAHAPVFQVMLNLLNFEDGAFRAEGLEVAQAGAGGELSSKFDLTLYVSERDGAIVINLVYAADLFDAPRMRGLLEQLEGVLRQAAAAPETRVGALSLATEAAHGVLPDPAEPLDATWRGAVHEVFAAQARRTPDALAVEDPRERWTYAELDAATDRIARALADAGVGVGDVVAITGHRSAALVRALIGTMKSGAAFLVLDPAYPAARLGDYVRIARPAAHLHLAAAAGLPDEVLARLADTIRTTVVLHPRGEGKAEEVDGLASSAEPLSVEIGPDTLAYLSFTSGTTGVPKAVMGRHSSLTHFTPWLAQSFGLSASDRFSLLSGLAHDPLHRDVFTPLQLGASVVAPLPDEVGTPGYLARWMREAGITVAHLTPAMGQLLADAPEGERIPSLHRAFFVGDVLRRADVARLTALAPALNVVNYYGSTETQRAVSYHEVDPANEPKEVIPLGRGLPGVQLLVRNAAGEIAGVGEVGEIWMRSPHLAAGYLNDPALAAERFLVNPWTGDPRDRMYRTGDLGRYRPDGEVEPLGRADQQVKVRGFRVELGEVESALAAHAAVKEAAVIARETEGGDRRLVAYWVPADAAARAESAELRAHLKALLPEYMVPAAFVRLDRLPLTANGKLDRRALPEPEAAATESRPAAPRTPTEEILAQIWAEVLRTESVGVDDDFFALGGHSLLATRLLARVQNGLGVVLPLRALFEGPTVAALAARAEETRRAGLPVLPPVVRVDRDRPLPLSFAQERLWFLDRLEGGSAAYNLPAALRLTGALDAAALERSLGEIVRRHEALRTVFREADGGAVQVIVPFAGFALPVEDLSKLGGTAREAEVRRRAREHAARPFDLAEGPLLRAALLRLSREEHVLLLCIHHIVFDGWSSGVLVRELSALYAAYRDGAASPLAEPPVQYADYAVWQREQLRGEVLDRQIGYWKERLAGAPALLELPTDRPRPPVQSHRGARETFELPRALLDQLQALGRSEGATLYMVMLGAFQLLLSKYSGSDDIVVGSPIAGRTRREVEELIGFFANTLVLRTDLSADPTFRELLGRVREGTLGAYEHQEVPFERLVAELQPERSLSHAPVFQVMFTLQNVDRSGSGLAGLRMEGVGAEMETAKVDLSLTAIPHDGGVHGVLEYSTDLFDRSTIRRMLGHLERVLEQAAANADLRLSQLELLGEAERALVLEEWNRTAAGVPADRCIHELFETQAAGTPDAEAVAFEGERLTYAELNARANRLAHHLRSLGVGPDARVGICVEPSLEMVVGVLAVLKAGGAYLPLDPAYPADRLRYMLEDGAPAAVLVQTHLRDRVEGADVPLLELDAAAPAWASLPATDPGRGGLTPEHLAYVIYTSGSTGRPKGVRVPHASVGATLAVAGDAFGFGAGDRVPSLASFAFDIWLFETLLPLLGGGSVRLVPRERVPDVPRLMEDLAWCTTVHAVPALMRRIVEEVRATPEGVLRTLRRAFVGGDAVAPDLLEEMRIAFPAAEIHVLYGPTEAAIICAAHRLGGEAAARQMVGRPLGNAALYVVEPGGSVAPVGVPGELCLGGASVARDYLGRPGLTAERFVPDPFSAQPGARLYRTGDRVRWVADGSVEFLGRTDHQVKVRGFRIEPGEIEARLAEHPAVREAVVLVREDAPGEKRLVAYVAGDETAGADVLRAHLSERLPEYMVPAAYVRLETLPLNPNGKVDRKALPAPEGDAFPARGYEAPSGKVEEAVAAIWAELLGAERVGRRDHFFEVGGHSLLAVRVVSRVRQVLGVETSPRDVFERPVLADFAGGLQTAARAEAAAIERVDRTGNIPLSFAQQRLWFLEQFGNLGSTYHIPMRLRLRGELDRDALARSLDRIVARHEALRTSFPMVDGEPVQRIAPAEASGFLLVEHDLRAWPDAEDELRRVMSDEASAPFDLAQGPLVRGRLVRMAADDNVLLLTMHHIVSDGWSTGVLFRELGALYAAFTRGEPDPLPPLPVQYADYAVWHRRWVEGPVLEAQAEYWTETLAGAPELLELPTDRPRPASQDFTGAALKVELDEALTAALKALSQRHGTTLFMTLLAGWAAVLARLSGQDDVVIGTPSANRGRAEVEELVGFFVNTLALRVDLSGAPTVAGLLDRVRALALEAQRNQDIPFEQVVELVQPARSLAHTPLFQVMFAWQNAPEGSLELPGLALAPLHPAGSGGSSPQVNAKFDLSLTLREDDGRIEGGVAYATALFDRATVERYVGYLRRVLHAMAADDSTPVDRLELLDAAERRTVVEEWNATDAGFPAGACIHELFEAQVERTPGAVAVSFEGERVTYAELNARANRLAHHLRALGVGPDARVGVCVERGPEMVAALLAILKAGGAYVPLDPAYPADRLRYMLEDSAPAALVTQSPLAGTFAGLDVPVVELDAAAPAWAQGPEANPARAGLTPGHLAYIIYTSGSTGRPKGVMVEHRSLVNHTAWQAAAFGIGAQDTVLQRTSISFDASVWELWTPLATGARMLLLSSATMKDPGAIGRAVEEGGATIAQFVPTLLQAVLGALPAGGSLPCRTLFCGGEPLSAALVAEARSAGVGEVVNLYGPTEATIDSTWHPCAAGDGRAPAIGRPVANARMYVLDARGEPAPMGVAGELYVGGAGVARGYLGRAGLTAERFVPDPFSREGGARMYRTGDLGRWRADGTLEYLGRTDFQVKVRGFRIELGEIEAALLEHEGVRECAVVVRDDAGEKRVVAYVVGDAEAEALRAHVRQSLPEYMVPAAFVPLERLPLTPNGKLDRKALPAPEYAGDADRYVAPRTPTEEVLAGIWAEVLKVERVGVHDNFFALGGHSLLAVTLVERMRRHGVRADVRALFTTPTVAELAAAAEGAGSDVRVPPNRIPAGCDAITPEMLPLVELTQADIDRIMAGVPGGAGNVQDIYPLAPLQEGILFHHLLIQEGDPYLLTVPFAFNTRQRLEAFVAALQAVAARHDILRTSVVWEGLPEPVQVVWRHAPLPVEEVEVDPAAGDAAVQLYERFNPVHYRIDLGRAPLLRACITHDVAGDRWVLLLLLHHVASDHTALDVLLADIDAHLGGRADQLPAPLPFRNYVAQARLGVSRAEHEAFFSELLGDVDEPTAPFGLREVRGDGRGLEEGTLRVEEELGVRLRERARALGVSAASVCHVAWAQVLARTSGRDDVVFGTVLFGRMQGGEGADRVLGPFINTLPVRIRVGEEGAEASVRRAQALLASLVRHEHAPLALAQQYSGVPAPEPLFSALFNYRHVGGGEGKSSARRPKEALRVMERSNYPLTLSVNDQGEGFYLSVQVEAEVGAERVCALMHTALAGLVQALEEAPERPLRNIEVLPEAERRQVVEAWNRTAAEYPADRCIHELFEAQAARTPGAVAVRFREQSLTYGELNARANRLAHHLAALGVRPETRVAIYLERGPEMVVSVLAVLKAGGAYVPLDPVYPAERLAFMLANAAAPVLVTQESLRAALVAGDGVAVVSVDVDGDSIAAQPAGNPEAGVSPGHLAYVIYTSGSTGTPKGVLVQHRSLSNLLAATREAFGVGEGDLMPALASYAFDIWLFEALLPLTCGAAVRMVERERVLDVPALVEEIADATLVHAVPALMRQLVQAERETPRLGRLRRAFVGGDQVPADLLAEMREVLSGAETHVLYGPTEGTILASTHPVPADGVVAGHPIGRPLGNVRLYVCDALGSPQPAGVAGELLIGGAGVARGYLGRAGLTAERFVPDPFSAEGGARLYRTGDRARWRADGTLEFLGRTDFQVKIRGFRIEPGEIEAVLSAHPEVREARVIVWEDAPGEKRLVAYVVGEVEVDTLREHLRGRLPEYMVPSAFVFLDALPLTPNGKLDRKALPAPDLSSSEDRYVAPRTPVEEALAGIWAEVLKVERVGVEDSFFELGGHSLLATRVVSRIRGEFGIELPLRALFEGPTVAALAPQVEALVLARVEESKLAEALEQLEGLSDEEVMQLLGVE
jgi:amino acid adenylation domain-containing protein